MNVVDLLLLLADFGTCNGTQADFDGDGCVSVPDLLAFPCPGSDCPRNVNGDGVVDGTDVATVAGHFAACP